MYIVHTIGKLLLTTSIYRVLKNYVIKIYTNIHSRAILNKFTSKGRQLCHTTQMRVILFKLINIMLKF